MIIPKVKTIEKIEEKEWWNCLCEPCKAPTCLTNNMCYVSVTYDDSIQRGCLTPDLGKDCPEFKGLNTSCCTSDMCNDYDAQTADDYYSTPSINLLTDISTINSTQTTHSSDSTPIVQNSPHSPSSSSIFTNPSYYYYVGAIVLIALSIIAGILYVTMRLHGKWRCKNINKTLCCCKKQRSLNVSNTTVSSSVVPYNRDSVVQGDEPASTHSCFYQQTTFVKQITFDKLIEKGSQIEIWKGTFQNDAVAIKCFRPPSIAAWEREVKLYKSFSIRNDNILRYIGSDIGNMFYCIVFDYHDQLSLHDFLCNLPRTNGTSGLGAKQIYALAYTASKGLLYLHNKISGTDPKASIAHRDLKSKNILVRSHDMGYQDHGCLKPSLSRRNEMSSFKYKNRPAFARFYSLSSFDGNKRSTHEIMIKNSKSCMELTFHTYSYTGLKNGKKRTDSIKRTYSCCISDLGLAICDKEPLSNHKIVVGTKRYMAPEILKNDLNASDFESFKMADIYSFGLVLWEILTVYNPAYPKRPPLNLSCQHFVPYHEYAPKNPTVEEMKKIVVDKRLRPLIKPEWQHSEPILPLVHVIKECLHENPKSRLTALRIKLTLQNAYETLNDVC